MTGASEVALRKKKGTLYILGHQNGAKEPDGRCAAVGKTLKTVFIFG